MLVQEDVIGVQTVNFQKGRILYLIFGQKYGIIPYGIRHKSLEVQKNLVQDFGTRWYLFCTVYIFSTDDILQKGAVNPKKTTIMANIPRYLQIYIPAGPHWGGRGRKFKSCHSDQNRRFNRTSDFLYFTGFLAFFSLYLLSLPPCFLVVFLC